MEKELLIEVLLAAIRGLEEQMDTSPANTPLCIDNALHSALAVLDPEQAKEL